ncbi:M24 family metallopeptidase [Marinomonas mediterranea]|uniref:aminopeptidase P N-terminal domain-containing protein n=1 Tax=Marinomonas mediterranea TaxID=119864 RepID=UPI002349EB81|nr:aminopeptidase P N-terminal domain-containing protein [Marinomonas mediterranea]WCN12143.1 M24 family metallopeptidase [Marinomonas mediterranea]
MNISKGTYKARRQALMSSLPEGTVLIVRTGSLCTRNNDCDYEFRPHSSFFYLSGFPEPEAYLIIDSAGESTLATLPKDPEKEQWDGFRYGVQGSIDLFGVDHAIELDELDDYVVLKLNGASNIAILFADEFLRDQAYAWVDDLRGRARIGAIAPTNVIDASLFVEELRLRKDNEEVEIMEAAAQISVKAHIQAMKTVTPGMLEGELEAELNYIFMKNGSRNPAYSNIVASGANACVLHYIKNDERIEDGDLVLIDAGCELGCYASDITRTFPANGKFSEPQAKLYQLVLDAYHSGLKELQVNNPYDAFHKAAVLTLTEGLVELGLLSGSVDELIESNAYREFYMHNTGHWLGLDVHDCGRYKINGEPRLLEEGMVLTIEPGLYVSKDNDNVAEQWRGIGIRIEDDVLIKQSGPYVLTHGLAKEIDEIEALMAS